MSGAGSALAGARPLWASEDWTPGARRDVGWTWFHDSNAPDVVGLSVVQPV